jgi:tRNA-dihydrouridine synthase B
MFPPSNPTFFVREIPIYGDLILAPMDGMTDLPFRSMARRLGSAISYTEFINAMDVIHKTPSLSKRLVFEGWERPIVFQIYDDNPERLLNAALKLMKYNPDIIDINMGCSSKNVSGRGAGAGLLRTPEKVAQIFSRLTHALDIPITGKIRLGWDQSSRNYLLIARIVEENGGQLLSVHARTRDQGFTGTADWDAIAEIKQIVSIPVLGNGDVNSVEDIELMKIKTGCDGVMIGRAALDNPWIFSRLNRDQVHPQTVLQTIQHHLNKSLEFHGDQRGLIEFRKFAKRYLKPYPVTKEDLFHLLTEIDPDKFNQLIDHIFLSLDLSPTLS